MRFFILPFALWVFCASTSSAQSTTAPTLDSWPKGSPTNGVACAISFAPAFENRSPIVYVNILNETTNYIRGILRVPLAGSINIKLIDSAGNKVPKSALGRSISVWDDHEIKQWFENNREKPNDSPSGGKSVKDSKGIADIIFPQLPASRGAGLSLTELFKVQHPGKYTLELQLHVAQVELDRSGNTVLHLFWLPTLVTQVLIRSEDITVTNTLGQ